MFADLSIYYTWDAAFALWQVIMIDLVLAGDNAVVIGMAASGLPKDQRNKVVMVGIVAATVLRIAFASVTVQLLAIVGLLFAGGVLLLWVSWKLWREIREQETHDRQEGEAALEGQEAPTAERKTFRAAVIQIIVADVSMSLDNVLAVAGASRDYPLILIFGLAVSVILMGVAAIYIARLLQKHHWIAYVGLLLILYVALKMMWDGLPEILTLAGMA
ncbi:MAG: TerC family protein [Alphaproteobacteria bacterium]|nr:TerC family protein [Alphaproteobacteria bacterium]MBN9496137.1 TerC family protein [Alphaproteobacteria bacterium]